MLNKICKWYIIVNRPRCPLINSIMVEGMTHLYKKDFPMDYTLKNYVYVDGYWYGDENYDNKEREEIAEKLAEDPQFLLNIMNSAYKEWQSFEKYCQEIKKRNQKRLTNKEIKEDYDRIITFLLEWDGRFLQFMWLPERILEMKIKDLLGERSPKDAQESFLLLTSPKREGFFEEENRELLKLISKIQSNDSFDKLFKKDKEIIEKELPNHHELQHLLSNHLEKFCWLANSNFKSIFWNTNDIIWRIKDLLNDEVKVKLEVLENTRKEREEKIKRLISILNLNRSEIALIETTRELVYFRTFRTDIQWKIGYYVYPLFQEIASRTKISIEDFHNLTFFEISSFLDGAILDKLLITKRKHRYAMIVDHGKINYYYDEKKIDEIKRMVETKIEDKIKKLKGSTASPGVVRGKVKIIHNVGELSKIKVGDILITSMTKPDYIVAMEKAAAFVTDEGGILCHAAIISREMNKPCIIGTEKATKVFKDGDLVEVDATNGIVRKIK